MTDGGINMTIDLNISHHWVSDNPSLIYINIDIYTNIFIYTCVIYMQMVRISYMNKMPTKETYSNSSCIQLSYNLRRDRSFAKDLTHFQVCPIPITMALQGFLDVFLVLFLSLFGNIRMLILLSAIHLHMYDIIRLCTEFPMNY